MTLLMMTKKMSMQQRHHHSTNNTSIPLVVLLRFLIILVSRTNAWAVVQVEPKFSLLRMQQRPSIRIAGLQVRPYCKLPFMEQLQRRRTLTSAFTPLPKFTSCATTTTIFQQPSSNNDNNIMQNKKKQVAADGTQRGAWLLGVVLLACLWIFSIPPEFRRAYLCGSDRCVQNRSAYLCNDCMTPDEWKQGIVDYYRTGGGVQFDFSIDPKSKMKLF
jgi:hypothetical protein